LSTLNKQRGLNLVARRQSGRDGSPLTVTARQQRVFVPSVNEGSSPAELPFMAMFYVEHDKGQVQASLKSDRSSTARADVSPQQTRTKNRRDAVSRLPRT
jgi:hypothetical protein